MKRSNRCDRSPSSKQVLKPRGLLNANNLKEKKMEYNIIVGRELSEDKHISSCSSKNRAGLRKDRHSTPLEYKLDNLPSILDTEQLKRTRCSHLHQSRSFTDHLAQPKFIDFTSTSNNTATIPIHSEDLGLESLHFFCRRSPLSRIYKLKTFRQRRKVQSVHSLTDLLVECSPVALSGNLVLSPSTRWIIDSIEATLRTIALVKSSVIFRSAPQNTNTKHIMQRHQKSTKLIIPHSGPMGTALGKQGSGLSTSKQIPFSSSSNSYLASSHLSNSSVSFNSAFLHFVWENGKSYFLFTMGEEHADVYIASPHKIKTPADKALDYIYVFNELKGKSKKPKKLVGDVPDFVGKMEVRSSLFLNFNRSRYLETEFVLSAANEGSYSELQSFSPANTRYTGPYSKISEIFKRNHHVKISASSSQFEQSPEFRQSELGLVDKPGCKNLELAAIVVQDFGFERRNGASSGGWGLKFLQKADIADADSCQASQFTSVLCSQDYMENKSSDRNVSVLVPARVHSSPITGTGGPSSLIERWRSNGHCDCGGWDLGCTLTVLNSKSKGLLQEGSQENSKSINLSKEGAKNGESAFRMFSLSKDMYLIYFQSNLSHLQSFSTAVALIHSQTPDLYPTW